MKRILNLVIFLLVAICGQSQTVNQKGVTYRYNGKNPRTPIGGVYIKPITAANGVVSDESSGTFTLAFDNLKMGSRIGNVRVTKQGMMVFNQQAVDEWSVRKDPLCLILCNADEFQKQKKNLIAIGESQAKKKYDKKLAELKKQNDAKQLKIDEYYNKLDSLEKEYQNALKHMAEYADVFARIDESEVDTIAQRAIELFNNGKLEESVNLFEQGNYMKKLEEALRTKKQAQSLKQAADTVEYLAEKDIEGYRKSIMAQISAYKLNNEWVKAGELLKGLADKLNDYLSISGYACYCYQQYEFDEGHSYFLKYLELEKDIKETDKYNYKSLYYALAALDAIRYPSHFDTVICRLGAIYTDGELQYSLLIRLANIYIEENEFDLLEETINTIKQVLKRREEEGVQNLNGMKAQLLMVEAELFLKKSNNEEAMQKFIEASKLIGNDADFVGNNQICWINAQIKIANMFIRDKKFEAAEQTLDCTLDRCNRLIKSQRSSITQKSSFYSLYYTYGELYCNMKKYEQSEYMFLKSKEIIEEIAKQDTNWTSPMKGMIDIETHLSYIYRNNKRIVECEKVCLSALNRCHQLCMIDSSSVSYSYLASTQIELAKLYQAQKRYEESERMHKEALSRFKCLAKEFPSIYDKSYAEAQTNLADLYYETKNYTEGEKLYKSSLEIQKQLIKDNYSLFIDDYVRTQINLANLYYCMQHYEESEALYNSALDIYGKLVLQNPSAYEDVLALVYSNYAILLKKTQRYVESETMWRSALDIYKRLAKSNPETFEPTLANTQNALGLLYKSIQCYAESEVMYKSALEIYERLAKSNPDNFEPDLAMIQDNLGSLYGTIQRYAESEALLKSALEIRKRLANSNPDTFEPDLSYTLSGLALLYLSTQRYAESEVNYKSALEIYERLAKSNPETFEPDFANTQDHLGLLFSITQRYAESEEMYKSASEIYERLAKSNPDDFEPDLAKTQTSLALLYSDTQNYVESEVMYKSALEIYERLSKYDTLSVEPYLAETYYNIAILYDKTQRYSECVLMYQKSRTIYAHLCEKDSLVYEKDLADCNYWLGNALMSMDRYHEAVEPFMQALKLSRKIVRTGKDEKYEIYLESLYGLSNISSCEMDYVSLYAYNDELLEILQKYFEGDMIKWMGDYVNQLISQSFYSNLLGKFGEGEQRSLEALKVDSTQHIAYTNLAAALLFQGKVKDAEELYLQYKAELKEGFLEDFAEYERLGIIPEERKKDVERIKAMLNEP